jgi:hypothetical protein
MYYSFKENLTLAFKELRKAGYFARQNFLCCQSCAWSAVPDGKDEKVVFYHRQDADDVQYGRVYLAWSGNGAEIVEILSKYFNVEWDGSTSTRILVKEK